MNKLELLNQWLEEENIAHIKGWDFSHIDGRYEEEDLPWNYKSIIQQYLKPEYKLLDIDTGGGEFLLSLGHPFQNTSATEGYLPNVELCKETLLPLNIDFKEATSNEKLPFDSHTFDMVVNRHGDLNSDEIARVLKPGGWFITQQVGAKNDRDLVEMLLPKVKELPFPEQYLDIVRKKFEKSGFEILQAQEAFCSIKFYDIGVLVWFAHIIEWEFPDFCVQNSIDQLFYLQQIVEKEGCIQGSTHRFLLVAKKKID